MNVAADLDAVWTHRGGFTATSRRLIAYASLRIKARSTKSPGGQQVARLDPKDVFQDALYKALTSDDCPTKGEELYRLMRRNIDNRLRTLEKSPNVAYEISATNDPNIPGTIPIDSLLDESHSVSEQNDEEEEFHSLVVEKTRKRFRPNAQENCLLTHIIEQQADKAKICSLMKIDSATFDRLKHKLKNVITAVADELKGSTKK